MNWTSTITNAGRALLEQWITGTALNISSAKAGTGTAASLAPMTALTDEKQTMSIISVESTDDGIKLKLQITAPQTGYTLNQIGIFAQLTGSPVLLAVFQNASGISVPSAASQPDFSYTFFALIAVSNTGTLTVNIDTSALVTQATLNAAISELDEAKLDVPRIENLLLPAAAWAGAQSPFTQSAGIQGITADSVVDVRADETTLGQMLYDGTASIMIKNNNGICTAYAIGEKPTADLTVQLLISEVPT